MAADTTIIYLTDNCLDERVAEACKRHLLKAADGKRIISVSQKPMDFGENICVGDIGRSSINIDKQLLEGLKLVKTRFVAVAEHDVVYDKEHFNYVPPEDIYFYYNVNCWLLQYSSKGHPEYNGLFSFRKSESYWLLQSQLIANTDSMIEVEEQKIHILSDTKVGARWADRARLGEPGIYSVERLREVFTGAKLMHMWPEVEHYATTHTAKLFKTKVPNIDIRHDDNLTGAKRGKRRRWSLKPWGTMEDILNG